MSIQEIEKLTIAQAREMALETMQIKGHECIFVDFKDNFGYSVLVFKSKKQIYYANEYALHYCPMNNEELREKYIDVLTDELFTDAELLEDIKTYKEYRHKDYFLRNYWIMRYDYLSIYGYGKDAQQKFDAAKPKFPYYSDVSFCYVADKEIVDIQKKYADHIKTEYEKLKQNNDTFRKMISYELANHEACITYDYTEALRALGYTWEMLSSEQQQITKEELKKQCRWYEEEVS